jgi:hypothetical protein
VDIFTGLISHCTPFVYFRETYNESKYYKIVNKVVLNDNSQLGEEHLSFVIWRLFVGKVGPS